MINQKSTISAYTNTDQILDKDDEIIFDVINNTGCSLYQSSEGYTYINKPGLYLLILNATVKASKDSTITLQLYRDKEKVNGASADFSAENDTMENISYTKILDISPYDIINKRRITLTNVNIGDKATITNTSLHVIKLA